MLAVSVFVIDCTTIGTPPPSATFPASREGLETLSGLGQYIVSAILLFVYRQGEPLLDVNMARVLEHYFGPRKLADIRYDPYLQTLSRQVVKTRPVGLNWAILDLGTMICTANNPKCSSCPMASTCLFQLSSKEKRN